MNKSCVLNGNKDIPKPLVTQMILCILFTHFSHSNKMINHWLVIFLSKKHQHYEANSTYPNDQLTWYFSLVNHGLVFEVPKKSIK